MPELKNICKKAGSFSISNVSLNITSGGYFVILGPSGAGKTLLLEIIAGLEKPDSGSIFLDGHDITKLNAGRRPFGIVFQENTLFPHLNVSHNISYGLLHKGYSKNEIRTKVLRWAEMTNCVHLLERMPGKLSGGEARRVALARTLAMQPDLLLLDEPLASLDAVLQFEMIRLLKEINRSGITVVHVTHDPKEAWALAGSLAIMNNGKIEQTGTPAAVFGKPHSRFIAALAGTRNFFPVLHTLSEGPLTKITTSNGQILYSAGMIQAGRSCFINDSDIIINPSCESSGRNLFTGTVTDIIPALDHYSVVIEAGLVFCARVHMSNSINLPAQGESVRFLIPEHAVHASG